MFQHHYRDWTELRRFGGVIECDFHRGERPIGMDYWAAMAEIGEDTIKGLEYAQAKGYKYVLFRHGCSTSGPGWTTAASVVRGVMRKPVSTPYVRKSRSIQHDSVFLAAIKPGNAETSDGMHDVAYRIGADGLVVHEMIFSHEQTAEPAPG